MNPHLIKAVTKLAKMCPRLRRTKQTRGWGRLRRDVVSLWSPGPGEMRGEIATLSLAPQAAGYSARGLGKVGKGAGMEFWLHPALPARDPPAPGTAQLRDPVPITLPNISARPPG